MKLIAGIGSPAEGGCWMVAVQRYTEESGWSDHPECVCPIIRALCILANDWLPDGERERIIGPHLFAPVGTRNDALLPARLRRVVQFALDQAGFKHVLPALPTVAEYLAAEAAGAAEADYRAAAGAAAVAAEAAARAAAGVARALFARAAEADYRVAAGAAARAAARAASRAAWAAEAAAWAAEAAEAAAGAAARAAEHCLLPLILELCAMSTPTEVVPVRTREQVLREVCKA